MTGVVDVTTLSISSNGTNFVTSNLSIGEDMVATLKLENVGVTVNANN